MNEVYLVNQFFLPVSLKGKKENMVFLLRSGNRLTSALKVQTDYMNCL